MGSCSGLAAWREPGGGELFFNPGQVVTGDVRVVPATQRRVKHPPVVLVRVLASAGTGHDDAEQADRARYALGEPDCVDLAGGPDVGHPP